VIGRDQDGDPRLAGLLDDAAQRAIDGLDRPHHGRFVLDVTDDVDVGEVGEDEAVTALTDHADRGFGHFPHGHLGRLIEEPDVLPCRHHDAVLTGVGGLALAVEEVGDVKRLLRLGDFHLPDPAAGQDLAERFLEVRLGREGHIGPQVPRVLDHGSVVKPEGPGRGKLAEIVFREAARELDLPLAADIVEDDRVAPADPSRRFSRGVDQDQGVERLVILAPAVRLPHRPGHGIRCHRGHGILSVMSGVIGPGPQAVEGPPNRRNGSIILEKPLRVKGTFSVAKGKAK